MENMDNDRSNSVLDFNKINHSEITKKDFVGEGSFGKVFLGQWRNKTVAIKYYTTTEERKAFEVEVRQLSRVRHDNIIKLYGACIEEPDFCLVMEYAEGGSLFYVLHSAKNIQYNLGHALSWVYQCAKGVDYLHRMKPKPLIHRDLKPPNLLLVDSGIQLKICDFGTAVDKATYMTNQKGSAAWMAPEVFSTNNYTEKCDVYSWGIIFWEVLTRKRPFYNGLNALQIMWSVYKGTRPPLIEDCPAVIENLIVQCWDGTPSNRPNMTEIVNQMEKIVLLFPDCNQPVTRLSNEVECIEDVDVNLNEDFDGCEETDRKLFPSNGDVQTYTQHPHKAMHFPLTLPQPTQEMTTQLNIVVDPNHWELESCDDMELEMRPGFDKMIRKNSTTSPVQVGHTMPTGTSESSDPNLDNMYMLLDKDLRPATPDFSDPKSISLFEEHKKLAQEYLKVQTEMVYQSQKCERLKAEQSIERQIQRKNIEDLQNEKEALVLLREHLVQQRDALPGRDNDQNEEWQNFSQHEEL